MNTNQKTRECYEVEIANLLIGIKNLIKEAYKNLTASEYDEFKRNCDKHTDEILSEVEKITYLK